MQGESVDEAQVVLGDGTRLAELIDREHRTLSARVHADAAGSAGSYHFKEDRATLEFRVR
jgi:hypothetical protein